MSQTVNNFFTQQSSVGQASSEIIDRLLANGVEQDIYPGCVFLVGQHGKILYYKSCGQRFKTAENSGAHTELTGNTVFDIAALTEVFVTSTIIMQLVSAGVLSLEDRIYRFIQAFAMSGKEAVTLAHVLSQTSGLATWQNFYEDLEHENKTRRLGILCTKSGREFVYNAINRSSLKFPAGTKQQYSDLGFILLGHVIEMLTGTSLDRAAQKYVFQPLNLVSTGFIDLEMLKRKVINPNLDLIAPTEDCAWRKKLICGEVHDENAWAMGGVAGHSGVFSSALDLHIFASEMIASWHGQSNFVNPDLLRACWAGNGLKVDGSWTYGWDRPSKENMMLDLGLGMQTVGQNGLTGCSLWIDPERGLDLVLLSNRINLGRNNKKIMGFRAELTKQVLQNFAL